MRSALTSLPDYDAVPKPFAGLQTFHSNSIASVFPLQASSLPRVMSNPTLQMEEEKKPF